MLTAPAGRIAHFRADADDNSFTIRVGQKARKQKRLHQLLWRARSSSKPSCSASGIEQESGMQEIGRGIVSRKRRKFATTTQPLIVHHTTAVDDTHTHSEANTKAI